MKKLNQVITFRDVNNIQQLKVLFNVLNVNKNIIFLVTFVKQELINQLNFVKLMMLMKMFVAIVKLTIFYLLINFNVFKKS